MNSWLLLLAKLKAPPGGPARPIVTCGIGVTAPPAFLFVPLEVRDPLLEQSSLASPAFPLAPLSDARLEEHCRRPVKRAQAEVDDLTYYHNTIFSLS